MSLDIALVRRGPRDKKKRPTWVTLDIHLDQDDAFERACGAVREQSLRGTNLPMIARFDPWKVVVLTPADMEQFMTEVRAMADGSSPSYLEPALALARRSLGEPGSELHLLGD